MFRHRKGLHGHIQQSKKRSSNETPVIKSTHKKKWLNFGENSTVTMSICYLMGDPLYINQFPESSPKLYWIIFAVKRKSTRATEYGR